MPDRLICLCNFVEEKEISLLLKKGVSTTAEVQELSKAGTSCGKCLPVIDEMVEKHNKTKPKLQQGKLKLGF